MSGLRLGWFMAGFLVHCGASWPTGSMDEQTCGWVEVKARWTCSTYQVAMQRWIGIEKSPDSTLVVFSRFYSSSLEVEMDLHPVDFRVSELVPLLHCSRVPLSCFSRRTFWGCEERIDEDAQGGKMIHGSYDARNWKSLAKISHKDDKWLLQNFPALAGPMSNRTLCDRWFVPGKSQWSGGPPQLGGCLDRRRRRNWQRLLWAKSARSCQPPCLQADTRKLRRNSFKLGSCKRKLARPWLRGDCLMIHVTFVSFVPAA